MTYGGGEGLGTILKYDAGSDQLSVEYAFKNAPVYPSDYGIPVKAVDGKIYLTTSGGGKADKGAVVAIDPVSHVMTRLHDFLGTNGALPYGGLLQAANGKLYGMTRDGGTFNKGVLFSYDPKTNDFSKLYDFNGANGEFSYSTLVEDGNGLLYDK
jgi:uncharacterized repeat protein (TIGR03803 family)